MNSEMLFCLLGGAYELFVRVIPTKRNLSALDAFKKGALMVHNLIDIIIPNRREEEK